MQFEFTAGLLLHRHIRDFIKRCQFDGKNIKLYESSGLLERTFVIKGDDKDVANIRYSLNKWGKENNLF